MRLRGIVSIPKWCDWEKTIDKRAKKNSKFQFQNGAIESWPVPAWRSPSPSFNSKMVRLRGPCGWVHPGAEPVSIPKWCDWEPAGAPVRRCTWSVSIPKWCDWEFLTCCRRGFRASVSIPKWCDWEFADGLAKFSFYLVSIPKWCDWEIISTFGIPDLNQVSIPKWCDWEKKAFNWLTVS